MTEIETCPDLEKLACFTEGRAGQHDRAKILEHLKHCPSCTELVAETSHFMEEQRSPRVQRLSFLSRRGPMLVTLGTLTAAATLLLVLNPMLPRSDRRSLEKGEAHARSGLIALAEAGGSDPRRFYLARLPVDGDIQSHIHLMRGPSESSPEIEDLQKAKEALAKISPKSPQFIEALRLLLTLGLYQNEAGEAFLVADELASVSSDPEDRCLQILAKFAYAQKLNRPDEIEAALGEMKELRAAHPENAVIAYNFGALLSLTGKWQEARPVFQAFLTLEPKSPYADYLKELLRG